MARKRAAARWLRRHLEDALTGVLSADSGPLYYDDAGLAHLQAAAERTLERFGPPPGWAIPS